MLVKPRSSWSAGETSTTTSDLTVRLATGHRPRLDRTQSSRAISISDSLPKWLQNPTAGHGFSRPLQAWVRRRNQSLKKIVPLGAVHQALAHTAVLEICGRTYMDMGHCGRASPEALCYRGRPDR